MFVRISVFSQQAFTVPTPSIQCVEQVFTAVEYQDLVVRNSKIMSTINEATSPGVVLQVCTQLVKKLQTLIQNSNSIDKNCVILGVDTPLSIDTLIEIFRPTILQENVSQKTAMLTWPGNHTL